MVCVVYTPTVPKSTGFKSMVVAQFTGVSLQKDDNAFLKFNQTTGGFDDSSTVDNLHSDPNDIYSLFIL